MKMEPTIELEIIKKTSNEILSGCQVYLFGSRARNENQPDSDYDIMLVTKHTFSPKEKIVLRTKLRNLLAKEKIYADVIIQSETEIQIKKKIPGNVVYYGFPEAVLL